MEGGHCVFCCSANARLRCARCKKANYCNANCQRLDWKLHKLECKSVLRTPDIEDLAQNLGSKYDHNCECKRCGSLCNRVPGIYDPAHVKQRAAQDETFFNTCVQDYYIVDNETVHFYLRPAQVGETPASRAKPVKKYANCSHLTTTGCALDRRDRPLGCRVASGCGTKPSFDFDPETASNLWTSKEGQETMHAFEQYARRKNNNVGNTLEMHQEFQNVTLTDVLSMAEMTLS